MIVSDLLDEVVEIVGRCATPLLYKKITRAIESLSIEGNWDAQQLYLTMNVQPGNAVYLPREVLTPVKVNVNKKPAFSRTRLYEFSLSGPGNPTSGLTDFQWMDQNSYPLMADLPSVGSQLQLQCDPVDIGKTISFFGLDVAGNEVTETITLDGTLQTTANNYGTMRRVQKDLMTKRLPVTLLNGNMVANYYGNETQPRYRKIKLSKSATSIYMQFRSVTIEVKTLDDYIPLDSANALLLMMKAREIIYNSEGKSSDEAAKLKAMAVDELQKEQKARNAFAELASADEVAPTYNLNINTIDALIAGDVIDDVFDIFGPIGLSKALDRITDAQQLLRNKNQNWEWDQGYIDLTIGGGGIVTLPSYISRPIKINLGGHPLKMRNRWFEFHLNGPGEHDRAWPFEVHAWEDKGDGFVTVNDPEKPFQLVAINDVDADDGATVRVYGYDDQGRWITSPNPDLESDETVIDGVILTATYFNTLPDPQNAIFSRITRITRDTTNGYQQLLAYELNEAEPILIGYYFPNETEPRYCRIRIPQHEHHRECNRIRMRYRKRGLKISDLTDQLHLRSRMAMVEALRCISMLKDKPDDAKKHELNAVQWLTEEQFCSNPSEQFSIEIDESFQDSMVVQQ